METICSRILVLAVRPYRETSVLLDVVCEQEGRISLIARRGSNARIDGRKQAALAPLAFSEVVYRIRPGDDLGYVNEATVIQSWVGIRMDLERYAWGCLGAEVTARMGAARARDSGTFDALLRFLQFINQVDRPLSPVSILWHMEDIARSSGLGLGLSECQQCRSRSDLAFLRIHSASPGALCSHCVLPGGHYHPHIQRQPQQDPWVRTNPGDRRTLCWTLPLLWEQILGHGLHSRSLLHQVAGIGNDAHAGRMPASPRREP
jgi:DNA repair protein RecO